MTEWALNLLLTFKFKSDITNYILNEARADWRRVEYELRGSPVPAFGVIVRNYEPSTIGPLVAQNLSPERASEYFGEFPLEAAAINYIFTIIELFGDMIVRKTNREFFKKKKLHANWHNKLYGDSDTESHEVQVKMAKAFGEPFLVDGQFVDQNVVLKLIELKQARNEFAHKADEDHSFDVLFRYAIDIVCGIYFLLREDQPILVATPFSNDYDAVDDPFEDARYDERIWAEPASLRAVCCASSVWSRFRRDYSSSISSSSTASAIASASRKSFFCPFE